MRVGGQRLRAEQAPARLSAAAGTWFEETSSLAEPVPVEGTLAGSATTLAEGLVLDGADVLATYDHPHLGTWAAVTTRAYGAGRVTVVGTVPDLTLARSLAHWLVPTTVTRPAPYARVVIAAQAPRCGWS